MQLESVDSPRGKLVLLFLEERGPTAPQRLAEELDITLLATLGIVDTMCREGCVERRGGRVRPVEG